MGSKCEAGDQASYSGNGGWCLHHTVKLFAPLGGSMEERGVGFRNLVAWLCGRATNMYILRVSFCFIRCSFSASSHAASSSLAQLTQLLYSAVCLNSYLGGGR